ncbi:MAG: GNAT family N-acetyltransferase [Fidelibacterota bacterium]
MSMNNLQIDPMTRDEMNLALDWAAEEGWNPGLYDANAFYGADTTGFLIGKINNEPVAMISAVKYDKEFGFVGFYIVKPDYRGQGYGFQIWQAAMQALSGRNIGLDGVVDQLPNYRKSGFRLAHRNMRYQGKAVGEIPANRNIVDLRRIPIDRILRYDRKFFPAHRVNFLEPWIHQPEAFALGYIHDNQLKGYGVMRKCRKGYKIGPLFAENPQIAEALFQTLCSRIGTDESFYLDIPQVNSAAGQLVEKQNMELVFETARMYTGEFPDLPLNKIFGVTTFELG